MNTNATEHVETLQCDRCRKRWQVAWVESVEENSAAHALICDCGRVFKVVRTAEDDPPAMILQHSHWKTVVACIPAFAAGALFPVLSEQVMLTAYVLSWIGCAATFVNEDNRSFSALGGIALWSLVIISGAAAVGALIGHAVWWWWQ